MRADKVLVVTKESSRELTCRKERKDHCASAEQPEAGFLTCSRNLDQGPHHI